MATYMKRGSTWQARVSKDKHRFNKSGFATKREAIVWASKIELGGQNKPKGNIGLKSIFETGFKRHSEPRLPSTAQINH
ncbi:hypothetical protein X293_07055, partial [Oenococcus oeni IOEB_C52]